MATRRFCDRCDDEQEAGRLTTLKFPTPVNTVFDEVELCPRCFRYIRSECRPIPKNAQEMASQT